MQKKIGILLGLLSMMLTVVAQSGDFTFQLLNQSVGLSELTNAYISEDTEGGLG